MARTDKRIKEYTKKDGTTAYMFQVYLGVDPVSGKKRRTTKRGFDTKKEASLALSRLEVDIAEKGLRTNEVKVNTFKELFELWFEQHCNTIKPTTQERIQYLFNKHILPQLGNMQNEKITATTCQRLVNEWAKQHAQYAQMKSYISKVFKYGILINLLHDNPMDKIIMPKRQQGEKEELGEFYTKNELKYFFECLEEANRIKDRRHKNGERAITFFRLLAFTGARKGEVQALLWEDVDLENGVITFNKTLVYVNNGLTVQSPKTKSSNRAVSIDPETIKILRSWKNIQNERMLVTGERLNPKHKNVFGGEKKDYLYPNYTNQALKRLYKKFPDLKKIKSHGFRHTHASLLFESGADIKVVQQRLGHSNIQTTMDIYTHVSPNHEKDAGIQFAKYVNF